MAARCMLLVGGTAIMESRLDIAMAGDMHWLTQLLKRQPRSSGSLLRSVQFDTKGWTLAKRRRNSLEWRNADGDTLRACVDSKLPETLSGLSDHDSLRAFYREEAIRHGGGIVCAEIVQAGGIRSVKVINKYERSMYAYDGTLIIPFKNAQYTVTIHSFERGVTGERDALVTSQLVERGELEIESPAAPGEPGRIKGWFQDPYDPSYQGRAIYSMSDDDRLDALFPDHPLSKIRKCLGRIQATLVIDQAIRRDTVLVPGNTGEEEAFNQPRRLLSSPTVASLYLLFGSSLLEVGRFDDAERLFDISISELERAVGKNDPLVAKHLFLLGMAHHCQGRYQHAESALSRARSIFEQSLGQNDLHTAQATLNLARVYISLARHDEAEPLFLQALSVFNEKDASGSSAGIALNGLGLVYNARGLYVAAIPFFEQALQIFERVHGPEFTDCATALRNMALSLRHTGDDRRAEEALNRARRIKG
jgi:tetratricopeptide (TPR) repeat protein